MGGVFFSSPNIKGHFIDNNTKASAGSVLKGSIDIELKRNIGQGKICILFQGTENISWKKSKIERNSYLNTNESSDTLTFYYRNWVVCEVRSLVKDFDSLSSGNHNFSYTLEIPKDIPSSFSYSCYHRTATILYTLSIVLMTNRTIQVISEKNLRISQMLLKDIYESKKSALSNLKTWLFINKGYNSINVKLLKDTFVPRDIIHFFIDIDNSISKLNVNGIECRVFFEGTIKVSAYNKLYFSEVLIVKKIFHRVLSGEKCENLEITCDLASVADYLDGLYSTNSNLIDCNYFIEIKLDMDGKLMFRGRPPKIYFPIFIVPEITQKVSNNMIPKL
ncbi:hypothetical protein SteCoe_35758 [Stentor coeruleus]|uniref:Uncharacterized protein n=1 Tax=Stentor coeruleus TaxID=5963 RepID=A0A1R2ART2_9CILI|nr:hypothetical protein SteCoe_35758 [Stentor coeruleus]